jgi:hypothetical protein
VVVAIQSVAAEAGLGAVWLAADRRCVRGHQVIGADGRNGTAAVGVRLDGLLPPAAALVASFRHRAHSEPGDQLISAVAGALAVQHREQWRAEERTRDGGARPEVIVANKRLIDRLNARRVEQIEQVDEWVAEHVPQRLDGRLHTETLGSVIDRLAIAWVRMESFTSDGSDARAEAAERQLGELAIAYDQLVHDVVAGHRRLPNWRSLKSFRSA